MEKKMTKRDYFGELKKLVADRTDLVEFIDHELELLDKKASSSKMTKTQIENEGLMENILEKMVELGSPITVTDLVVAFDNQYTNEKLSALLKKLVDTDKVEKTTDKKKSYFQVK